MGTSYTGQGISHKYDKLIATAAETVFLKCPPTNAISNALNETAMHFVKRGFDVDRFMDPIESDKTDAIFIKGPNLLFLQASHPVALEPTDLGGRHRVISFYHMYEEEKLREMNKAVAANRSEADIALEKALHALAQAKKIHDEWETVNIDRMMWNLHEQMIASLKEELFGTIRLNKKSAVSHRMIGSLTFSGGAHDYIPSITKWSERRLLIKGLPGTGKSTLMRALGAEGERRGFDVLYGWCGLDPSGVDLVQFPELSVCLFDATQPHAYDPERPEDELLDLVHMCAEDAEAEERISTIREAYREKIMDATGYMQAFAQARNNMIQQMDSAIREEVFNEKAALLLQEE
ncbi:hypothetical protein AB1K83_09945 [Sporosarcina sp. 179-K 3D1 HS]|uniref:hypothetical protein n=1 Tax=Sporosarcina sp. 179-K 3D1 HS TaxID=3232169 RepID=UPI0039A183AB